MDQICLKYHRVGQKNLVHPPGPVFGFSKMRNYRTEKSGPRSVRYVCHFWRWCSCPSHHRGRVNSGSFWPRFLGRMAVWYARSPFLNSVSGRRRCPVGAWWEVACGSSSRQGSFTSPMVGSFFGRCQLYFSQGWQLHFSEGRPCITSVSSCDIDT